MKEISIKRFDSEDIEEVTLLSKEEWELCRDICPNCIGCWWLQSPGLARGFAAIVYAGGSVDKIGYIVDYDPLFVRPAFILRDSLPLLKRGDHVFVGNIPCTVVSSVVVFADYPVCMHGFDEDSNDYETSEIKKYINSDEFAALVFGEAEE